MDLLIRHLNTKLEILSKTEVRYSGIFSSYNQDKQTVTFTKVLSHGTENRLAPIKIPASPQVYEYIAFKVANIAKIRPPNNSTWICINSSTSSSTTTNNTSTTNTTHTHPNTTSSTHSKPSHPKQTHSKPPHSKPSHSKSSSTSTSATPNPNSTTPSSSHLNLNPPNSTTTSTTTTTSSNSTTTTHPNTHTHTTSTQPNSTSTHPNSTTTHPNSILTTQSNTYYIKNPFHRAIKVPDEEYDFTSPNSQLQRLKPPKKPTTPYNPQTFFDTFR
ncbi:hypothetical protein NEHOM01_2057 [Nematocida homosporus]|uniref:uncharacterized protein n=1 Tax=Nematocida homosporus TaxID=1912981 RepID=UPI00221ECD93|nr:uncharacterized protein NEHOM01_2057 [Nematocida homosporus]KAI5187272.1 hypothetical protein NEHOM01_2057 [Nematocida homosporus]